MKPKRITARVSMTGRLKLVRKSPGFPELSQTRLASIRRAVEDSLDPIRYIIVAPFAGDCVLHYRVEDAGMGSHISMATLFKERKAAEAVRKSIVSARVRKALQVVRVKKNKAGVRLVDRIKFP